MNTLNLDQSKFKSISSKLLDMVNNHEGEVGHSQMLQFLSQSIYNKPYEEVKETYFSDGYKPVYFFSCHGINYVFVDDKIVYKSEIVDSALIIKKIRNVKNMNKWNIYKQSNNHNNRPVWSSIPLTINGKGIDEYQEEHDLSNEYINNIEPEAEYVYKMATMLGYTNKNLLSEMCNARYALVNNIKADYLVSDGIYEEIEENGFDALIWTPEAYVDGEFYEFYFTLNDMANAVYLEDNKCWKIVQKEKGGKDKIFHVELFNHI